MMTFWDKFFKEKISDIFKNSRQVIDIGGGLRISKEKGNRYDASRAWILDMARGNGSEYKILDPTPKYNPDIIGDIHNLPFADNSQEAIICMSVLEHVENPIKACGEIYRVLESGGRCFVYLPFLYYFHAEKDYYKDYWRFTKDAIGFLFGNFSVVEVQNVRGALATWIHISPLAKFKFLEIFCDFFDKLFCKSKSSQTSGYYIFLRK